METDGRTTRLHGRRILVLEEHPGVAELLGGMVKGFGCEVLGPVETIEEALALISDVKVDAAILDVTIKGKISFAIADELSRRGTPFVFASGNKTTESIERYAPASIITKPYSEQHIFEVLCQMMDGSNQHAAV